MTQLNYKNIGLSSENETEIETLLHQIPSNCFDIEDLWTLMDLVWNSYSCDNKDPDPFKNEKFYRHPVWVLNGLFVEQHDLSKQHRQAIRDWIISNRCSMELNTILDYGGGFGSLARLIAHGLPEIHIDVFEPHPSELAKVRASTFANIRFVHSIAREYDCLISLDVLEHVTDPLRTLSEMIESVRINGFLLIANNFFPIIKCHLPGTFHLRYTFMGFARMLGLVNLGPCSGSHAIIYRKASTGRPNWNRIRRFEKISKMLFPALVTVHKVYRRVRQRLDRKYRPQLPL